ncbi:MAG: hypothetical protein HZY75_06205 [Nocardioidaceae bacterium]|nr:MAG: hypothetical protein HZY75_06205 [Nocardioidaceae bacterium]
MDEKLKAAVLELEAHAAGLGWDQPARLYALVDTAALIAAEPELAEQMGIAPDQDSFTAVEQESLPEASLEETLLGISWPDDVDGCAAVLERVVLPPEIEDQIPGDDAEAAAFAAAHPDRHEVRIVAAVTRAGGRHCAMRVRTHDDPFAVLDGPDLVPTLLELLATTLILDP